MRNGRNIGLINIPRIGASRYPRELGMAHGREALGGSGPASLQWAHLR